MKKYEHFDELFEILDKSYVAQYQEFDETGRCYYSVEHCLSLKNDEGAKPFLQLLDAKTGKIVHVVQEETDFHFVTTEDHNPIIQVNVFLKSNYQYVFYAKKL